MKRKSQAQLEAEVTAFNNANPVGTSVVVTRDDGTHHLTKTRSEAFVMGGHSAMIQVHGISGAYRLDRVNRSPATPTATNPPTTPLSDLSRPQLEHLLLAHTLALEDACLATGVPYDRSDPRKTIALLTAAVETATRKEMEILHVPRSKWSL